MRGEDGVGVGPDLADVGLHVDQGVFPRSFCVNFSQGRLVTPTLILDLQVLGGRGGTNV